MKENTFVKKIELSKADDKTENKRSIIKVTLSSKSDLSNNDLSENKEGKSPSKNDLSKIKKGMWMTFTMHGNKRPLASKGKARACAFSPPRSGDDSPGSSKHARAKLEESHVAFGIDDGTIEVWDAGLRRFVERIDENKLQTGVGFTADQEKKIPRLTTRNLRRANISQKSGFKT